MQSIEERVAALERAVFSRNRAVGEDDWVHSVGTVTDDSVAESIINEALRIGTSDLKIASIALVENAVLLTANTQDFERVPGLQFENWLE